jgi:DMSO/TMAO reductase YedYZ molybdopterin-dependent catalytic subunit
MNGEVLPREHGYPARLLVPDRYGMKNAKWVIGLRPMRREFLDWYGQRQWSKQGLLHTMCRIDEPAPGATLVPGSYRCAGVAYAGRRGIGQVEVSTDGGLTWRTAELLDAAAAGQDRWVRWRSEFTVAPGQSLNLVARATDGAGQLQTEAFHLPQPDGGTGWPRLEVRTA